MLCGHSLRFFFLAFNRGVFHVLSPTAVEHVGPGREGAVIFGHEEREGAQYALAYVFKIKDSRARGFQVLQTFFPFSLGMPSPPTRLVFGLVVLGTRL